MPEKLAIAIAPGEGSCWIGNWNEKKVCVFHYSFTQFTFFFHVHAFTFTKESQDFPRGPVVKNLSVSTGDMGSIPGPIPGPGRFHMLRTSKPLCPNY